MQVLDLTHKIAEDMPVYFGTDPPVFDGCCNIENYGFKESRISMFTHIGTHVDPPSHILREGASIDSFPISKFIGSGCVFDVISNNGIVDISDIRGADKLISSHDFILLRTGWADFWHNSGYYDGYPVLSVEAAKWISDFNIKGIGVDAISLDRPGSTSFPIHKIILDKNIIIIENLKNLDKLPFSGFKFICMPLKIIDGDGSPVRAAALLEETELEKFSTLER